MVDCTRNLYFLPRQSDIWSYRKNTTCRLLSIRLNKMLFLMEITTENNGKKRAHDVREYHHFYSSNLVIKFIDTTSIQNDPIGHYGHINDNTLSIQTDKLLNCWWNNSAKISMKILNYDVIIEQWFKSGNKNMVLTKINEENVFTRHRVFT